MSNNQYSKDEVRRILGYNKKQFKTFLYETAYIPFPKNNYSFNELVLLKRIQNFNSLIDALLLDPPMSEEI